MNEEKLPKRIVEIDCEEEIDGRDVYPIHEMAKSLDDYRKDISAYSGVLYYHVIYIVVLGNMLPNYVDDWKGEVFKFSKGAIMDEIKVKSKNFDRTKHIREKMMGPHMGAHFEDYDDYAFREFGRALKNEIYKGERMLNNEAKKSLWPSIKKELAVIKKFMNDFNESVPVLCKDEIVKFYDGFLNAAKEEKIEMLSEAIENLKPVIV